MDLKEYWEQYRELVAILSKELPTEVTGVGEFILKWSPFVLLVVVFAKLIDKLFESALIKFLANCFVRSCKYMWTKPYEEPVHKGIITEAPKKVQRWFHITCAWFQGIQAIIMFGYIFLAIYPLLTLQIRADRFVEGIVSLSLLSLATIFIAFVQLGLCQQSIKLAKSLKSN